MLHCGTIRQTVQIVAMALESDGTTQTATTAENTPIQVGRTGDRAKFVSDFLNSRKCSKLARKFCSERDALEEWENYRIALNSKINFGIYYKPLFISAKLISH